MLSWDRHKVDPELMNAARSQLGNRQARKETMEHLDPGAVWFGQDFRKGDRAVILATEEHEGDMYVFFTLIYREGISTFPSVHFWELEYLEESFFPVETRLYTERWPL